MKHPRYTVHFLAAVELGILQYGAPFIARITKKGTKDAWVNIYKGNKKVASCNPEYFKAHFFKVKS